MRTSRTRVRIALAVALVAAAVPWLAAAPAQAAEQAVDDATFTWKISEHAWTSSSLSPSHATTGSATKEEAGFAFADGAGTYDPTTGELDLDFAGSVTLGNTVQGGYRIRLADPAIVVDAAGDGTVTADVSFCGGTAACLDPGFNTPARVVVAAFETDGPSGTPADLTWVELPTPEPVTVVTPAFEGALQFPQTFISALGPSSPSLDGHFRQTNAAGPENTTNLAKLPAPFTLTPSHEPPAGPAVVVDPSSGLDPDGDTVTVSGTGFEGVGIYVRLCSEPPGPVGTVEGRPTSDQCDADHQHWVSTSYPAGPTAPMAPDGSFSVELDVAAAFGDVDCSTETCGIAIRRDHLGGTSDASYDSFTPVSFGGDATTTTTAPSTTSTTAHTTSTTEPDLDGSGTIVGGSLEWGFKAGFRSYVTGPIAQGSITVAPPATQAAGNGPFTFPLSGEGTFEGIDDVEAAFAGGVRFQGHHGELDLEFTDPQVVLDGDVGTLVVDTREDEEVPLASLDLTEATVSVEDGTVTIAGIPVALTPEGADALTSEGGQGGYSPGEQMDPATLVLEVDGDLSGVPTTPVDPDADKVTCTPTGSVPAGSTIRVCGSGFLPGEQVRVFLHSEPVQIGIAAADASGAVDAQVTIPATAAAGQHRIELRGVTSGRSIFSDPFTVTAPAGGVLPRTGAEAWPLARSAAALLVAGALAIGVARRRRLTEVAVER